MNKYSETTAAITAELATDNEGLNADYTYTGRTKLVDDVRWFEFELDTSFVWYNGQHSEDGQLTIMVDGYIF